MFLIQPFKSLKIPTHTIACCGTGTVELSYLCNGNNPFTCKDASKYVFWDSMHPTEKLYHIVADQLIKTTLAEFL
ncbi:hypothetical protein IFM89_034673 [Coptis chinensis]|uniref:GDSL esterase/lipase n=1 Tax=Coptis chinensis TaxID=261450 RepID=A0A835LU17_9MAGN|nr:hypothetical protein IFM89_034673 [Coptis chinensis]